MTLASTIVTLAGNAGGNGVGTANGPSFLQSGNVIGLLIFCGILIGGFVGLGLMAKSNKAKLKDQAEKSANYVLAVGVFALAVGGSFMAFGNQIVGFLLKING